MDYYCFMKQYGKKTIPSIQWISGKIVKTYSRVSNQGDHCHLMPGEEWVWDNYYLLQEWWRPFTPASKKASSRIRMQSYLAALYIVLCSEGQATEENIIRYADQYQEHRVLTLPELNVFPEMLRLCLLERIGELCELYHRGIS